MTPPQAFMPMIPLRVPVGLHITHLFGAAHPWGAPAVSGARGTTVGALPEPAIVISSEWPYSWARTLQPVPKFDVEWLHLRRFSTDQALATGVHAFAEIRPGGDPPDATARTEAGPLGVEATALTVPGRRDAHALFLALRRRLAMVEPTAFRHLAGHLVYVWFEGEGALAQPPRRSDEEAVASLVEALHACVPDAAAMRIEGTEMPTPFAGPPIAEAGGARFYAMPLLGGAPASTLFAIAGFELAFVHNSLITASDAWAEVERLIAKHDQAGVDFLLISAGAPNGSGEVFPSEEAVAELLMATTRALQAPQHIEQVVLHIWSTGTAYRLYPDPGPLFGPIFQALVPVHHSFLPQAAAESQSST